MAAVAELTLGRHGGESPNKSASPCLQGLQDSSDPSFPSCQSSAHSAQPGSHWDKLKVHPPDAARGYCFTFHAQRTGQLRVLRVRAKQARAAYVAAPSSQHALDELRHTTAALQQHRKQLAATDALRAGVLLHEYGDQSTYYFHHLHKQREQLLTQMTQFFCCGLQANCPPFVS